MPDNNNNIELRLVELAGDMKALATEMKSLVKLVEKDVSSLRSEYEGLRTEIENLKEKSVTKESLRPIWFCGGVVALLALQGVVGKLLQLLGLPIGVS